MPSVQGDAGTDLIRFRVNARSHIPGFGPASVSFAKGDIQILPSESIIPVLGAEDDVALIRGDIGIPVVLFAVDGTSQVFRREVAAVDVL